MTKYILAFDLGTGGSRASLYDENAQCIGSVFEAVKTRYSHVLYHEQQPESWWQAIVNSCKDLLKMATQEDEIHVRDIVALAIGGQPMGTVPVGTSGELLTNWTPIWSDGRAWRQSESFFTQMAEKDWYERTGSGVPTGDYPLFKILWLRDNDRRTYSRIAFVLGTKDYINMRLTGQVATDPGSAAGYGNWNIRKGCYDDDIIRTADLPPSIFPEVLPATQVLGKLLPEAAIQLGLSPQTKVIVGSVDNCCIALGARCNEDGRVAASLGSGSWIARCCDSVMMNYETRPFVLPHIIPGKFLSSFGIFSTGTALRWVKNQLCRNIEEEAIRIGRNPYFLMSKNAIKSTIGANKLIFNPSFVGSSIGGEPRDIRGGFLGLSLNHTQADIIRATMEGIAMNVRMALDRLRILGEVSAPVNLVGDPLSELVRNIYMHTLAMPITTSVDAQNVPALGAAAVAAVGAELWSDFSPIESLSRENEETTEPDPYCVERYSVVYNVFKKSFDYLKNLADDWNREILLEQN